MEDLRFHGEIKIYITWSLCQYYRMLWHKNLTAWAESTVFISLVNLSKLKLMRIALR